MAFRIEVAHDIAACAATIPLQQQTWSGDQIETQNAVGNAKTVTLSYKAKDAGAYHIAVRGQRNATGTYQLVITAR